MDQAPLPTTQILSRDARVAQKKRNSAWSANKFFQKRAKLHVNRRSDTKTRTQQETKQAPSLSMSIRVRGQSLANTCEEIHFKRLQKRRVSAKKELSRAKLKILTLSSWILTQVSTPTLGQQPTLNRCKLASSLRKTLSNLTSMFFTKKPARLINWRAANRCSLCLPVKNRLVPRHSKKFTRLVVSTAQCPPTYCLLVLAKPNPSQPPSIWRNSVLIWIRLPSFKFQKSFTLAEETMLPAKLDWRELLHRALSPPSPTLAKVSKFQQRTTTRASSSSLNSTEKANRWGLNSSKSSWKNK